MSSSTRAALAYEELRRDILNGRYEPGSRLRLEELSERYAVSSSVLREVLPRLVGQGLALQLPQQGFRVMSISTVDLHQLTEARVVVETLVLRQSLAHGDADWEAQVVATHHRLSRTPHILPTGDINEEWAVAHNRFHNALLAGCANERLRGIAASLRDSAEVYRHWSKSSAKVQQRDIAGEHLALQDLAIKRDVKAATQALRRHIELTTELLLRNYPCDAD